MGSKRRTSLRLEVVFVAALEEICRTEDIAMAEFFKRIDHAADGRSFSSAVRIAILKWYVERARNPCDDRPLPRVLRRKPVRR